MKMPTISFRLLEATTIN